MQINIDKKLINLANQFLKPTNNDVAKHLNYREQDSILTDGYRLLSIPNSLPIIETNKEVLATLPVFNWDFYKRYSGKKCIIEADTEQRCYRAMLDNELIAKVDFRTDYPECDRAMSYYSFNLAMRIDNPVAIYDRLKTIQTTIKEFNSKQRVKKQSLYNSDNAQVIFTASYEGGCTFIRAEVDLIDAVLNDRVKDSLLLFKGALPKNYGVQDTYRVVFNLNKLISCFDAIKQVAASRSFTINISFDTSKTAPFKLSIDSGAWCILMPIREK